MKLLVTGAAGKLGARLVARLHASHEIVGLDARPAPEGWPADARFVHGDLRDVSAVDRAAEGADVVIHLGAISGRARYLPQAELFAINVQGTFHVLEAAQRGGARMVILASSLCALGLPDAPDHHGLSYLPVDEDHPCRPRHTYDLTKRINEIQAEAFTRWSGVATVCLRFPFLVDLELAEQTAERVRLDPPKLVLADYLDQQDAIDAIDLAMHRDDLRHEVLFLHAATSGTVIPTPEYIQRLTPGVPWRGAPPEATTPLICTDRIREVLNWSPKLTWQQALAAAPKPG